MVSALKNKSVFTNTTIRGYIPIYTMADIGSVVFTAPVVPHVLWKPNDPLTIWVAAAYFGIDIVQCLTATEIMDMVIHSLVCHTGYIYTAYTGVNIGLANEALLWELSTPFLQLRRIHDPSGNGLWALLGHKDVEGNLLAKKMLAGGWDNVEGRAHHGHGTQLLVDGKDS